MHIVQPSFLIYLRHSIKYGIEKKKNKSFPHSFHLTLQSYTYRYSNVPRKNEGVYSPGLLKLLIFFRIYGNYPFHHQKNLTSKSWIISIWNTEIMRLTKTTKFSADCIISYGTMWRNILGYKQITNCNWMFIILFN